MFPVLCVVEGISWERGRPARTMTGTASGISSTWIDPTAPWLSFGLAVAVTADVVAACKAARKLSDHHKQQHAGGTPALPGVTSPLRGSPHPNPRAGARERQPNPHNHSSS